MKKIILLSILFYTIPLFAVSSGTFTINQWGTGNFTSAISAEAGLQGSLISDCYIIVTGSWTVVDNPVIFAGWTTYSTATVKFQATGLAKATGIWDTTRYRIQATAQVACT